MDLRILHISDTHGVHRRLRDLLEEEIHIPGTITHYFRDYEYAFLMEYALKKVSLMFPEVEFPR
ncbi:MAG: hypothetical protein ACI395_00415 [Candidatus Cryptobacteroides sp.]